MQELTIYAITQLTFSFDYKIEKLNEILAELKRLKDINANCEYSRKFRSSAYETAYEIACETEQILETAKKNNIIAIKTPCTCKYYTERRFKASKTLQTIKNLANEIKAKRKEILSY